VREPNAGHRRNLGAFSDTYDRGRGLAGQVVWFVFSYAVFQKWWFPPRFRPVVLRLFGGQVSNGVLIRHGVRIMWPWKLSIGQHCWIGESAWIINLEPVVLGDDVCLSQGVTVSSGGHDHRSVAMSYRNQKVILGPGTWVAARATVLPGVITGRDVTIAAGEVLRSSVADACLYIDGTATRSEKGLGR
jgi:putative colanic acid biosynthesis acetyltransferase WcaF